jgi:putative nucleotidyltransferase with HDIG domain
MDETRKLLLENEEFRREIGRLRAELDVREIDLDRYRRSKKILTKLRHTLEEKMGNLTLINEITASMTSILSLEAILSEFRKTLEKVVDFSVLAVFLLEPSEIYLLRKRLLEENHERAIRASVIGEFNEYEDTKIDPESVSVKLVAEERSGAMPKARENDIEPLAALPLRTRGKQFGMVALFGSEKKQLDEEAFYNLNVVVNNATIILDNALLYDKAVGAMNALSTRVKGLQSLLEVSKALTSKLPFDDLLEFILDSAIEEINGEGGSLMLIDEAKDELYLKAIRGLDADLKKTFRMKVGSEGTAGTVAMIREPIILIDERHYDKIAPSKYICKPFPFTDYDERKGTLSAMSVPLMVKHKVIGVLNVTSPDYVFCDHDLELLTIFSSQAANAIENSRLYLAEERRVNELAKLNEIGKALNSTLRYDEIFKLIMNALKELLNFSIGSFFLVEEGTFKLSITSEDTLSTSMIKWIKELSVTTYYEATSRRVKPEDVAIEYEMSRTGAPKSIEPREIRSYLIVPIMIKGKIRGLLNVNSFEPDAFDEDNLRTLSTFSSQVAVVLDNARSYQLMEQKVRELSMLFEVSKTIASTLDLDKVLELIVSISAQIMGARVAFLRLVDEETGDLVIRKSFGLPDTYVQRSRLRIGEGVSGKVVELARPFSVYDIDKTDMVIDKEYLKSFGLVSILAVPLVSREKVIGVITTFYPRHHEFSQNEVNLLQTLASHATIAIENAKLYKEMHENYLNTITALAATIDAKDHSTHGHSKKVMEYSVAIARELGLEKEEIETIRFAGLLHDIGKIGISEGILLKQDRLTDAEFDLISEHPKLGLLIMKQCGFLNKIAPLTYHHHEKYDGTGYPDRIKGNEIPLGARILSVADSFEVMTSTRPYREALPVDLAVEELKRCSGTQFDPSVVKAFMRVLARGEVVPRSILEMKESKDSESKERA